MKTRLLLTLVIWAVGLTGFAQAYNLAFQPVAQNIFQGDPAQVSLNLTLDSTEVLQGFDIDVSYDSSVLTFDSGALGAEVSGWLVADLSVVDPSTLNIFALDDALSLSNGLFTLATLNFFGQSPGLSLLLSFDGPSGGLLINDALFSAGAEGSIAVNQVTAPIPEPSTWLLMVMGLLGLVGMKKKFHRE
jgi:hypothetical protein